VAIKKIPVPFCDCCGEPWLPVHHLPDGTLNPAFDKPQLLKRCGKCKKTGWNAGGVDRRRKAITVLADPEDGPVVGTVEAEIDIDIEIKDPRSQAIVYGLPVPLVSAADVEQTIDRPLGAIGRCRHGLYSCPQCHPEKAA
jgi:hypothetical protein